MSTEIFNYKQNKTIDFLNFIPFVNKLLDATLVKLLWF